MKCPKCGKTISDSAKFCGFCGKKFTQTSTKPGYNHNQTAQNSSQSQIEMAKLQVEKEKLKIMQQQNEDVARCPKCGSTSLSEKKKGYGVGKAAVGGLIVGPFGLLAGGIGANKRQIKCLKCGHEFKFK